MARRKKLTQTETTAMRNIIDREKSWERVVQMAADGLRREMRHRASLNASIRDRLGVNQNAELVIDAGTREVIVLPDPPRNAELNELLTRVRALTTQ